MKQQDFLDLILASQTTLKQELLPKHPESKYQLLMLQRSFDLLAHYIVQAEAYHNENLNALQQYFQMPIEDVQEGIQQLAEELRLQVKSETLNTLRRLNQADLSISHPKVLKHG